MSSAVRWKAGAEDAQRAVEAWLAGRARGDVLHDNPRRRLVRLACDPGRTLLVKHFRTTSGRHPLRERAKAWLGRSPAAREWRALRALHAAGVPVPEPLAWGVLPGGDQLVVLAFVPGRALVDALRGDRGRAGRALAAGLGRSVGQLHAAGFRHGDLHHGNVLVTPEGEAVLLDLQHARRGARRGGRLRDLGFLDASLQRLGVSATQRQRVARAALGLAGVADARARAVLRALAEASAKRAREHARSRTRRALRPGRASGRCAHAGAKGLRARDLSADALALALDASAAALRGEAGAGASVLKADARSQVCRVECDRGTVVVKSVSARGLGRPLADLFRGSAGWRAWRGGHGLRARGIGAARPLAYLERRRFGLPVASVVVLEDLAPAAPADAAADWPAAERDDVLAALADLAAALHRARVEHGDLKASHVLVRRGPTGPAPALIDLEGVRFRDRALREGERIHALAQLNASLSDAFGAASRCRAFARYARALPFAGRGRSEQALAKVVQESLARRHRWTGEGCALAGRAARGVSSGGS